MDAQALRRPLRRFSRLVRRWSLGPHAAQQIERWQALEETGRALEETLASPGWTVVESCKLHYQHEADTRMRMHTLSESQRFQAAVEWNTVEALFRELRMRVREGQKARESLSKVNEPAQRV